MPIRNQTLMILQSLRNTFWQHIKQHALRFLLFFSQKLMLLVELASDCAHCHDKVAHQKIYDGRHGRKVEREEETDGFHRHTAVVPVTEIIVKASRYHRHHHVSDEPG